MNFPFGTRLLLGLSLLCLLCLLSQAALASHYRLPASGIATKAETGSLAKQDIRTTQALLKATAKSEVRRTLGKVTGISFERLTELASLCDLLRVDGLGPSIARLMRLSDVADSGVLRRQSANSLLARMRAANATHGIMEVLPSELTLASWIKSAAGLPKLLEGKR